MFVSVSNSLSAHMLHCLFKSIRYINYEGVCFIGKWTQLQILQRSES